MKNFYTLVLTVLSVCSFQFTKAQSGPNLLGAKGTFSTPFITVNSGAASCTRSGSATYNPAGNIGNALTGCASSGSALPCSGYTYTSASGGLIPEFRYTIIKNVGDANGGNCIKGDWRGQDHTGDGGYFMAVNGAPNSSYSNIFYQIKSIPVCPGTKYEFSAWVLNILPKSNSAAKAGSEPNISFKVITADGTQTIGTSGAIPYTTAPTWVKVGGTFTASSTATSVDLQVVNATAVASGNDLGLDDISFSVVTSNIALTGSDGGPVVNSTCEGSSFTVNYVVTDNTHTNTWYKWQKSTDGGATFVDSTLGVQTAVYNGDSFTLPLVFNKVTPNMTGYKYRLVVSTSEAGLSNPGCTYLNEYTVLVNSCGALPVTLTSFTGRYSDGGSILDWQTSQEFNSDHFELFKSTDGQDFSLVAKIKSAGSSNLVTNYSYQDNSPSTGSYVYYRLKQVDANGKYAFSSIVKLALGVNTFLSVYPNPFSNDFTASFSATKPSTATLILHNSTGQIVYSKTLRVNKGNNSILVNNLPSLKKGVYYMTISNEELNFNSKLQKL
ncbi:MAG: T9SS type A sorting domain-containing protein [Ginsengibacter sp.]